MHPDQGSNGSSPGATQGRVHHDAEHGTAASLRAREPDALLVAPATGAGFNTVELDLVPSACLALRDTVFAFDSSFIKPDAGGVSVAAILARLETLRQRHLDPRGLLPVLSVFGHADPVGNDEYNKQLSGRRAKAVYALLTHRVDLWEQLIDAPHGGDDWKVKGALDTMRHTVGAPPSLPRAELIQRYMAALFPTRLPKTAFLGRGADAGGKADFQGCGELNAVLRFAQAQERAFAAPQQKAARDAANQPNRRVLIYLFAPGIAPSAAAWPCPRASEGSAGCNARLFADAAQRRAAGTAQREFLTTGDTFACRFYDRIAARSPCEQKATGRHDVRVVPETFTRAGNVIAALERVDGQPLPDVESITLAGREIDDVFAAPDGKIYFLPPRDGDDGLAQGGLENGQTLAVQTPARFAANAKDGAAALRAQMAVLRQFTVQLIAFGRRAGEQEDDIRSAFCMVVGDAHVRFVAALDALAASQAPEPERRALVAGPGATAEGVQGVDDGLDGFMDAHGDALHGIGATLPHQKVEK